jgi:hypothetical protein
MDTDKSADESPPGTEEEGSDFKTFEPTGLGIIAVFCHLELSGVLHSALANKNV